MHKKILITYPYFLPAYKTGGPIQSIANLCRQLANEYDFYIACGDKDTNAAAALSGIISDEWNDFEQGTAKVYYISAGKQHIGTIRKIIKDLTPDIVFANGIFLPLFSIVPLVFAPHKKIISARGMLHPGALTQKRLKKQFFLSLFKFLRLHKRAIFHATDNNEQTYIHNTFGKGVKVMIAQNFPRQLKQVDIIKKDVNELKLVSIALIGPMKNHALVLEALKRVKSKVCYTIYGPVKDEAYWHKCEEIIKKLPENIIVVYKGDVQPDHVPDILSKYHCFALPSKGENFGHAIYEALSAGKPVITSNFTPWNDLERNHSGWNVDISDVSTITVAIETAAAMNNDTYRQWSEQTVEFAQKSIDFELIKQEYRQLFS